MLTRVNLEATLAQLTHITGYIEPTLVLCWASIKLGLVESVLFAEFLSASGGSAATMMGGAFHTVNQCTGGRGGGGYV